MSDVYREAHHVARVIGEPCRMMFCSLEYDADRPPDEIVIDGVRWIREDLKTEEEQ